MFYINLKILHILSASCVLISMTYSFYLWHSRAKRATEYIQKQTSLVIIPFALLQLGSGFTMISLQRYNWHQLWISGSIVSFITAIISWFGFLYFLLLSQQSITVTQHPPQPSPYHRYQSLMLVCCGLSLLSMIFFMANKNG